MDFANAYRDLGGAVQDQLAAVLDDPSAMEDCNPNALELIARFLERQARGFRDAENEDLFDELAELASAIREHLAGEENP
jgi:hypothetical protein